MASSAHLLPPKLALIVDDEPIQRYILKRFLTKLDYQVIEAVNGLEGVNLFVEHLPDLVFMDVVMPIMDGIEAATLIKSNTSGKYTPIIFLTAIDDPMQLHRCIEAGGDDFLNKPLNAGLLNTRMIALERTRDLYNQLHTQHDALVRFVEADKEHQLIAQNIVDQAIAPRNHLNSGITYYSKPASLFSGDMLLCGPINAYDYRVMLVDFTGHGLAASMLSIPVSETFHSMRLKGSSLLETLEKLNQKLCRLLPDDRFMAASLMDIRISSQELTLWSGGMPALRVSNGDQSFELATKGLPLGILENYDFSPDQFTMKLQGSERILMCTDGLLELSNEDDQQLQHSPHYQDFTRHWQDHIDNLNELINTLVNQHAPGKAIDDDITVIGIDLSRFNHPR